jgi:L-2-amino-thiazoline-4-carboxylic acid hydrolase
MYVAGMLDDSKPTPHELTRWLERHFFLALESHRAGLAALARARLVERAPQVAHLIRNALDEMNVSYTLLAVAGFDALLPIEGETSALRTIDTALHAAVRPKVLEGTAAMLDAAADPFAALVAASKAREQGYFGESFEFHRVVDDDHGYVLEIRRCLYHQVVIACGRPQLMPLLCRADTSWIDAIDPKRHHLRFVRPSTFATATTCRMWFMRTDGDDATTPEAVHGP